MPVERYIGLDPHGTSCTFGVIGPSGRKLRNDVVETNGKALVSYLRGIPGRKHLCLEEGTLSGWLHEVLEPHVEELVVTGVGKKSRGPKRERGASARPGETGPRENCPRSRTAP